MEQQQQQQILHFCDTKHSLVFDPDFKGPTCCGCQESIYGPGYLCRECWDYRHHKSCAELPLGLHHPLHPIHPLILSPEQIDYGKHIQFSNCKLCHESRNQYTYRCSRCDFNLHITCAFLLPTLEAEAELHDHPLILIGKWITFTCDLCGKEDKDMPFLCTTCGFWIHRKCAYQYPRRVKVVRHKHLLHLTHSSLEFHPSDSRFCQICVGKVDTQYGLYYCSRCDFAAHLDCAIAEENREDIDLSKFECDRKKKMEQQLLHFCDSNHPLLFRPDADGGHTCCGCQESVYGPSYRCLEGGCPYYYHHKSCAELPLGLHHPLHPIHPLILSPYQIDYGKDIQFSNCKLCNESRNQYTYRCSRCDFNLHITCASVLPTLEAEAELHDHPLIPFWKWITFTCDLCGKEDKGMPFLCNTCFFWIHKTCAYQFPCIVKVVRHKHLLHLTHSSLEFHQSDSRFCQICVQKVDTRYGLYYCSRCNFVAHLNCAIDRRNKEDINLQEFKDVDEVSELNESAGSTTYQVKKSNMKEDGTQIVEEIKHISHEHDLKLTNEVPNNQICDGCVRAILPPFYSCVKCRFFLHDSCAKLPPKKQHPLHRHPLILLPMKPSDYFRCKACSQYCNGFTYRCEKCDFDLDVQCSLISDILTHEGHEHPLILSYITHKQKCSCCSNESDQVFRCSTCEFALDYKCATLPHTTRYNQHEHPFTLCYRLEDDSGEYYCDICEEERDSKHWFYYCEDCSYPAHPKCILGKFPNCK